jgi:predicted Zn-dependent protease
MRGIYDTSRLLWNNLGVMKIAAIFLLASISVGVSAVHAGQNAQASRPTVAPPADPIAEAYAQFLMAHRFEDDENADAAIAAYRRAMTLDPGAASIVADLASLYMRLNRAADAIDAGERALEIDPANREAHRVLGTVYASMATTPAAARGPAAVRQENLNKGIQHLEQAIAGPVAQSDANVRAMLARLYVTAQNYDKAIPMLTELVKQEPGWQDGAVMLVQAYTAAGRSADAVRWLEEAAPDNPDLYGTLADFYSRQDRWAEAAVNYALALEADPRSTDLRLRYATSLLNAGKAEQILKARDVLRESLTIRANDERALYLLAQAERQSGDFTASEQTARRMISLFRTSPRGYVALSETLEERQAYEAVIDALAPALSDFRAGANAAVALGMLLPHLGFAYQQVGQAEKAVATFEEARKLSPGDPTIVSYLIQAQISAKKFAEAAEVARVARQQHPDDLRLARLEAQALRQAGKTDEGIAILEALVQKHRDDPQAYIALAQVYSEASRGAQAIKTLQNGQARLPSATILTFELGAVYDKQKRPSEAEAAFRQVIASDPEHAAALNYLGYMLAERGEKLDESVDLVKRALKIEPENGAYLDSLGWAYYKAGKLDLAEENLKRAADQLIRNSVIQDHYGDVLVKLGRLDDAIAAWTRALSGDGDSIERGDIDRKIRAARQKLPKR